MLFERSSCLAFVCRSVEAQSDATVRQPNICAHGTAYLHDVHEVRRCLMMLPCALYYMYKRLSNVVNLTVDGDALIDASMT